MSVKNPLASVVFPSVDMSEEFDAAMTGTEKGTTHYNIYYTKGDIRRSWVFELHPSWQPDGGKGPTLMVPFIGRTPTFPSAATIQYLFRDGDPIKKNVATKYSVSTHRKATTLFKELEDRDKIYCPYTNVIQFYSLWYYLRDKADLQNKLKESTLPFLAVNNVPDEFTGFSVTEMVPHQMEFCKILELTRRALKDGYSPDIKGHDPKSIPPALTQLTEYMLEHREEILKKQLEASKASDPRSAAEKSVELEKIGNLKVALNSFRIHGFLYRLYWGVMPSFPKPPSTPPANSTMKDALDAAQQRVGVEAREQQKPKDVTSVKPQPKVEIPEEEETPIGEVAKNVVNWTTAEVQSLVLQIRGEEATGETSGDIGGNPTLDETPQQVGENAGAAAAANVIETEVRHTTEPPKVNIVVDETPQPVVENAGAVAVLEVDHEPEQPKVIINHPELINPLFRTNPAEATGKTSEDLGGNAVEVLVETQADSGEVSEDLGGNPAGEQEVHHEAEQPAVNIVVDETPQPVVENAGIDKPAMEYLRYCANNLRDPMAPAVPEVTEDEDHPVTEEENEELILKLQQATTSTTEAPSFIDEDSLLYTDFEEEFGSEFPE